MEIDTLALILNAVLLTLVIVGTGLLIWRLKLGSKNKVLLFILFILYWMAPLMCREYTGQMHIHQPNYDGGSLLWVPLTVYGLAGLLWRPLTDIISYKMKSRKNVIYISLGIQLLTLWPLFVWPMSFACNIIQSIGTGVGASGIGLFNLMFSHEEHHRKVFATVSILALPPLIAEFITSCMEAVLCGLVPEHGIEGEIIEPTIYLQYLKWLWLFAIIFIIASFIITKFIKEDKKTLYVIEQKKEIVSSHHDGWFITLMCLVGICFIFVRWITAGPSSVTQLIYIAIIYPDTAIEEVKFFEGYLSLMFAFGQLIGAIIAGVTLSKRNNNSKWILVLIGALIWILYLETNIIHIDVHTFFWTNILNGLGFGLMLPVFIGVLVDKRFQKVKIITPLGLFNTAMAIGIIVASIFNSYMKGAVYDFHYSPLTSLSQNFDKINMIVNYTTIGVAGLLAILFGSSFAIQKKHPPIKRNIGKKFAIASEMEI